jgi:multiple sugar transport system permease protein
MILALLLHSTYHSIFNPVARVLVLVPWMVGESIVAIIWMWMLDPSFGILNYVLIKIGLINQSIAWLGDTNFALLSTIIVRVWRGFPFIGLLLLAGLQAISENQYEAAAIDGANSLQVFLFITLPNLGHIILVALTLDSIWTMRSMALVNVLTEGGPVSATKILAIRIYDEGFQYMRLGTAATYSVILLLILILFASVMINRGFSKELD